MTNSVWSLLRPSGLGNPPYVLLGVVVALGALALGHTIRLWRRQKAQGFGPAKPRGLWYAVAAAAPIILAAGQGAGYWPLIHTREVAAPWFTARFGPWVGGDLETVAWASAELVSAGLATAIAAWAAGRLARRFAAAGPLDGYWLSNPVSAVVGLALFAAVEPAMKTDFEHWGEAMWLTRVFGVVPIYAWVFHLGATGGRTRA
jgi:hypothetical protein